MDNERNIRRTVLPNGLTILTEKMDHLRSVAMGMWIRAGSRHESAEMNGISHFVEHMVFKGTTSRSAQRIAREVDAIGGNLDAFTGKETVCFNIKVLDEHAPVALEVLSDLVLNPVFAADEIVRERGVILEEIKIDEDNPDYLVHEIFTQNFWKGHALGKPILGTRETVKRFERENLTDYYGERFLGGNMIFSAAGNIDHDSFVAQVTRRFEGLPSGESLTVDAPPKTAARIILKNKNSLEQVQLCLGVPSPPIQDSSRYVTLVLNTILGGGMSSRLFQTIREERGLAYSIYSDLNPYRDTGSLCVYAGTSSDKALQMIELVMEQFKRLKNETLPADELRRAKDQLRGNLLLSLESSTSRMSNLARQQMYFQYFFGMQEILDKVEEVTADQVMAMANKLFQQEAVAVTLLGRLDGLKLEREHLAC
ncbi:M16 family metallopeptidase [Acidipila rosea]|uniref:Putative Zn-dependent peptidase n=1 Tax=Acidipila rosea TaxID=768535 RepID=A0A4R1LBK7_9BACT|nr:pitrilysin family protein [Acidipila rosea]MBW4025866.1 insulinase family protein [Acidobacteriota bacterium]MBW4044215.1 insulinase family protein [Acidobacteriota bacterium]TCK75755.1 putative Zn-dependent peptidase [Acidipila rosea]